MNPGAQVTAVLLPYALSTHLVELQLPQVDVCAGSSVRLEDASLQVLVISTA